MILRVQKNVLQFVSETIKMDLNEKSFPKQNIIQTPKFIALLYTLKICLQERNSQLRAANQLEAVATHRSSPINPQRTLVNPYLGNPINPTRVSTIFTNQQRYFGAQSMYQQNQTSTPTFVDNQLPNYEDLFPNDPNKI